MNEINKIAIINIIFKKIGVSCFKPESCVTLPDLFPPWQSLSREKLGSLCQAPSSSLQAVRGMKQTTTSVELLFTSLNVCDLISFTWFPSKPFRANKQKNRNLQSPMIERHCKNLTFEGAV